MSTKHGVNGVVKLGAAGVTGKVMQLKGWSFSEKLDESDNSVAEQNGKTSLAGLSSWTGTIDVLADESDAVGQGGLTLGAVVILNFYDETPITADTYWVGTARISGRDKTLTIAGVTTRKYTLSGQGVMSTATV